VIERNEELTKGIPMALREKLKIYKRYHYLAHIPYVLL
jgi:hypothetical protein